MAPHPGPMPPITIAVTWEQKQVSSQWPPPGRHNPQPCAGVLCLRLVSSRAAPARPSGLLCQRNKVAGDRSRYTTTVSSRAALSPHATCWCNSWPPGSSRPHSQLHSTLLGPACARGNSIVKEALDHLDKFQAAFPPHRPTQPVLCFHQDDAISASASANLW
jgi:hypothetical protein